MRIADNDSISVVKNFIYGGFKMKIDENLLSERTREESKKIPMPSVLPILGLVLAALFFLIIGILFIRMSIEEEEANLLYHLTWIVLEILCIYGCKSLIQDYKLAKTDFRQYQIKIQQKKEINEANLMEQQRQAMAQQIEKQALQNKRAEYKTKGIPSCPKCGSTSIATVNRGYSLVTGFVGSGKAVNVCQSCGYRFKPGT